MKMTQTVTPFKCNNQPRFSLITIPVPGLRKAKDYFMKLKNTLGVGTAFCYGILR